MTKSDKNNNSIGVISFNVCYDVDDSTEEEYRFVV